MTEAKLENVELDDHDMPRPIKGKRVKSMVVCEITVTQDMLNAGGNLHGGCSAWLLDVCVHFTCFIDALRIRTHSCTSLALIPFQAIDGWEYTGVTTDLQARYLAPAPEGTRLRCDLSPLLSISSSMRAHRMVSELLQIGGRFGIVDFRIYNADNQQLILAGSHTKASTPARKWKL